MGDDENLIIKYLTSPLLPQAVAFERKRFGDYCRLLKMDPAESERIIIKGIKKELQYVLSKRDTSYSRDAVELFQVLQQRNDLFEIKHVISALTRDRHIRRIMDILPELNINTSYINGLAVLFHISGNDTEVLFTESLKNLLYGIPLVHLFDLQFNAFVKGQSEIAGFPCICVYETLKTVTHSFSDLVLPIIIKDENGFELNSREFAKWDYENPIFKFGLGNCLGMLQGDEIFGIEMGPNVTSHKMKFGYIYHDFITSGAQDTVWYHEFGHLLLGHLKVRECHEIEYGADAFAFHLIPKRNSNHPEENLCRWIGAGLLFVLLAVQELLLQLGYSKSHPPAISRLSKMLICARENMPNSKYLILRDVLQWSVEICDPTLMEYGGYKSEIVIPDP